MSEIAPLISDLAIILMIAGIVTVIFKWLKQPVILGYIVAGIITGPSVSLFPTVSDLSNIKIWADIGVIFLLFAMGLGFSFKKLINVGVAAIIATITIVCGMMFIGYTAGNAMGFSHMSSIFLGGMLSMSSTAIVFKAFNDMGLLQQKFTGIVLGILVIEDLVAVVMMVVLSTLAVSKHFEGSQMLESILKLAAFLIFWSALGIYLIPTLLKKIRRFISNEILLITSLGLCLGMVMIATKAGFSAALGAFVMGSLLAETIEADKIAHIVQPVKDLFASIFFVSVGMMIDPAMMWEYAIPILILTLLVMCGQVLFGSFGVLLSGQSLKIAIQSGFSLTQVGEFAFIIASLGVSLNVTDKYLYPVIVAVSVITTFFTPYMIRLSEPAYRFVDNHLPEFLKDYIAHYTSGAITVKHQGTWHKLIKSMLISVTLYLVVCVFFITLYFSYVHPLIRKNLPGIEGNLLSFSIIFLVISPFLWAIIMKKNNSSEFHKLWTDNKFNRGPLVSMILVKILICTIIMMSIITHIFNVALGAGLIFSSIVIVIIYFSKRIRKRSLTIEQQFMANFQGEDNKNESSIDNYSESGLGDNIPFKELHLADFVLSPDSIYVGTTLKNSRIRTLFQVNIISITRGEKRLDIPQGDEFLYPFDRITVVGTDKQLEDFRVSLEQKKIEKKTETSPQDDMEIGQIPIEKDSPLLGKTLREADIPDCIIIGIERNTGNIMNPAPDTILEENDMIWIVGKRKTIKELDKD